MNEPVRVAVTGAAGQIGYSLLFRVASGAMLGPDQPVILQLLEITPALGALEGVCMELDDCAFPLLAGMVPTDDADVAVRRRRLRAARRRDAAQGGHGALRSARAPTAASSSRRARRCPVGASDDVKVLVVGNPANTNCLIAQQNAKDLDPAQFTAMTRLDHNRAVAQLAAKAGVHTHRRHRMTIWGNHSATQYPDVFHARGRRQAGVRAVGSDQAWLENDFIPTVQQRGAAIIKARGLSSAASAANAAIDHVRTWALGTAEGDWASMAIVSDGSYGVAEGLISSFPCTCADGKYEIVQGLDIDDFCRGRIDKTRRRARRGARRRQGTRPDRSPAASARQSSSDDAGQNRTNAHFRNFDVVLSARILPPVWQSGSSRRCSERYSTARTVSPHTGHVSPSRWCTEPGPVGRRAHVVAARARTRATRRCRRGSPRRASSRRRRRASPVDANGDSLARWQISLARRRPRPAIDALVAQEPVQAHRVLVQQLERASRRSTVSASGPRPSSGGWVSGSPATAHTPARRSVPASVSSSARPSSNTHRACPLAAWPAACRPAPP